jgi:hypothetical protein
MSKALETVLLLALPASGKSEVRRYLDRMNPEKRRNDFFMAETVQLDDFPYVHLMRRVDDELAKLGKPRVYFHSPDRPYQDPKDWGTLIELLNEDYEDLIAKKKHAPASAAQHLFDRFDRSSKAVGAKARMVELDSATRDTVAQALEKEARDLLNSKIAAYPESLEGKTLVVEFARGGKQGSSMPLPEPFGYRYSISRLSDALLEKASILYIWVTPEESRRKNTARTDPNDPGSILHHGVPMEVMLNDYGCDDMTWLEENSTKPGTVTIETRGRTYQLPIARFDNRVDKTSFIREDEKSWKPEQVSAVHEGLQTALTKLGRART